MYVANVYFREDRSRSVDKLVSLGGHLESQTSLRSGWGAFFFVCSGQPCFFFVGLVVFLCPDACVFSGAWSVSVFVCTIHSTMIWRLFASQHVVWEWVGCILGQLHLGVDSTQPLPHFVGVSNMPICSGYVVVSHECSFSWVPSYCVVALSWVCWSGACWFSFTTSSSVLRS